MFIPENSAEEIRQKAFLFDICGRYTSLKKKGKDYEGACPFCQQKHFTVNPAKDIYKCFDCEKGGKGAIHFVMQKEQISYPEALTKIAEFLQIYIPHKTPINGKEQHQKKPGSTKSITDQHPGDQPGVPGTPAATGSEEKKVEDPANSFFRQTCQAIGLSDRQNKVAVKWLDRASQSEELPLLTEDKEGNIAFLVYDINGFIITFEKTTGNHKQTIPYKVVRWKEPKLDSKGHLRKYDVPKGIGTRPFFPPNLLQKYQDKEKITTLCITEGYKKAIAGWVNGLDIVGLTSISTYTDKTSMQLHRDIIDLILTCEVENVLLLYDGDCRDISQKALDEGKDIHTRPNHFFSSARGIKELLKDYLKEQELNLYFAHVNSEVVTGHPKGLDDLYEAMINEQLQPGLPEPMYQQAKTTAAAALHNDLFSFSMPGHYFTKINITYGLQKLLYYLAIDNVNVFYNFHQERIGEKQFTYAGTQYKYNKDNNECVIVIPAAAKNYVRVGDDYLEKVQVPNKYKELETQLHHRAKTTIIDDYGKHFMNHIFKFKAFCNVPDHVNYQEAYYNCFNMYQRFEHEPQPGPCEVTLSFLQHIFEEQMDLGLDYLQVLYQRPTQILPILCLVSKENNTGKTTFAKWLKEIFRQNMAIVGNADLNNDFNSFWCTKSIICCEEVFIDKKLIVERIKNLSTADRIIMNQKGKDQVEIQFFGHFLLLTNNEDTFINISEEDIRYWVRKLKKPLVDNTGILKEMIGEIPAFLNYLNQRQMVTTCESRMWFHPQLLITDALKKVQLNSKSTIEKEIRMKLQNMFIDFSENIIYMTPTDIRREFFNNHYEERYITEILRDHIRAEPYWEPEHSPINPQLYTKMYKTKRYSFPKYYTTNDASLNQDVKRIEFKGNGRPFVFLRPDFVPEALNETISPEPGSLFMAENVPWWYVREGMLNNHLHVPAKPA
jgi:hypothetical protein